MDKKLNAILAALLNAQDYINGEMEAICDVDAMDEAKECFEKLDEAIVNVRSLLKQTNENPESYNRTWVGYQVKTKDDEFVAPYTDEDVFRAIEDAEEFIRSLKNSIFLSAVEKENLIVVSRWLENDDEEKRNFTFHGYKKRSFEKDEKVWDDVNNQWTTVRMKTFVSLEDEQVSLWNGHEGHVAKADSLYQLADGKVCPRCGNPLCTEHRDHIDYPFYCPDCQENFYNIEVE